MTGPAAGRQARGKARFAGLALAGLLGAGFWLLITSRTPGETVVPVPERPPAALNPGAGVELSARVEEVAPSRAFWVAQGGRRLLVLPVDRDTPMDAVRAGETVTVVGNLEKPASPAVLMREWGLDPRTAAILAREPVYLRARMIIPAPK